jgi:NadR type nicotinamide-nucleotide adenylyltransferase
MSSWDYLPRCVRPWFARRVCVFGPESTGKTTLAEALARHHRTVAVPEHARAHLMLRHALVTFPDLALIARRQVASEEALARSCNRLLVADTDALTTRLWSEALFGRVDDAVAELARAARYDLTLLCDVDVPWVADPLRYLPDDRERFFARCQQALEELGRRYVVIRGSWDERFEAACAAVAPLLLDPAPGA